MRQANARTAAVTAAMRQKSAEQQRRLDAAEAAAAQRQQEAAELQQQLQSAQQRATELFGQVTAAATAAAMAMAEDATAAAEGQLAAAEAAAAAAQRQLEADSERRRRASDVSAQAECQFRVHVVQTDGHACHDAANQKVIGAYDPSNDVVTLSDLETLQSASVVASTQVSSPYCEGWPVSPMVDLGICISGLQPQVSWQLFAALKQRLQLGAAKC